MTSHKFAAVVAVALGLTCGLTLGSSAVRAESFLNYILPGIFGAPDTGPKPEDTLQAPFGNEKPKVTSKEQAGLMNIYENDRTNAKNEGGLDIPHRSAEQVGEWVTSLATQALSIDPKTYEEKSKGYTGWFLPYALQEYQTYLATNQILETLKAHNMRLTAFAESKPVMVQEGVLEGSYRWLFRVPVMLSFYENKTTSLKGGAGQTQRVMVNVQVGRVPSAQLIEGMAIERWSVTAQ